MALSNVANLGFRRLQDVPPDQIALHLRGPAADREHAGIADHALRRVRDELIAAGERKLLIEVFAENVSVAAFCRRFGESLGVQGSKRPEDYRAH